MAEPLKQMFFTHAFNTDLATAIHAIYREFDIRGFLEQVFADGWEDFALKERMRHTTEVLHNFLPKTYRTALDILQRAAPAVDQYGFDKMVFSDYVSLYGLSDWEASLPALEQFTQQMSAEFAVRPFIIKDQDRMMAQMLRWAHHDHPEVRRLATEGCRPRLPWGISLPALKTDPSPVLPILEQLKSDESETVRRSVANNLNDIAKDNPEVVISVLRKWQGESTPEIRWITSHGLRTLVKRGNSEALALLGYSPGGAFEVMRLAVQPEAIALGEAISFTFCVKSHSSTPQKLMIDYVIYFMKANGELRPKVFKLTKRDLAPGETIEITRKHSFRPISTRRYYPGKHAIQIQINGQASDRVEFMVN